MEAVNPKCDKNIYWNIPLYRYICYSHNLFGSPIPEIWTKTPGTLNVSHHSRIYVDEETQFTVTVRDAASGRRLQYAKICLNKPDDIYQVDFTNANGQVTFTITPQTAGTLKVTVTRRHAHTNNNDSQYRPSQTTCAVINKLGGGKSADSDELLPASLCITGIPTLVKGNLTINYGIPISGDVELSIYDATGSLVKMISHKNLKPKYYQETINIGHLSSGIYFIVLKQNNEMICKKLLLIK